MVKKTVLIVDDAPENIDMLKTILQEEYAIKAAINGEKAWKILNTGAKVDLLLLDINMPVMDGYTLCKMVKDDPNFKEIPVIFITASHDSEDEVKGFEFGAADFITKPFSPIKVKARVKAHILLYAKKLELKQSLEQLKETQGQLVESQKMASLGSLAAGVAHELNTPLGISITAVSTLMDRSESVKNKMENGELKRSDMVEYLSQAYEAQEIISKNLNKSANLVDSFKAFSLHDYEGEQALVPIMDVMRRVEERLRLKIKDTDIQLTMKCVDSFEFKAHIEILESVVERLAENAVLHGFKGRDFGTITIGCQADAEWVMISIGDDGRGIPESEISSIFQPFFTTERIQGYSGLGLSTVYNLVYHKLKGTIEVRSEENIGTIFTITIPKD